MRGIGQDVRFTVRSLRRAPGFAALVILTLAIGIGANTAVFSILYSVLLRPLSYPSPDRIVALWESRTANDRASETGLAPGNFLDWRAQNRTFTAMTALCGFHYILTTGGPPKRVEGGAVSAGWWNVFGTRPKIGRVFTAEEDRPSAPRVAVLTDRLWRERFHSDPQLIGKTITLNDEAYTVLGVMLPDPSTSNPEIGFFAPLEREIPPDRMQWREARFLEVFARLKPGITMAQASDDLNRISASIRRDHPAGDILSGATVTSYREVTAPDDFQREIFVAFAIVGLVLIVACANVSNLVMARGASREHELAVRIALGARPVRVLRQFVVESLCLAFGGSVLALPLSSALAQLILHFEPETVTPVYSGLNAWAIAFSFLLAAIAGAIFGLVPAVVALGSNTQEVLRRSGPAVSNDRSRGRLRHSIAIAEIACSVVLLSGTGLLLHSLMALKSLPLGFETENRVAALIQLPRMKYLQDRDVIRFYDRVTERVRALPGVLQTGIVNIRPLAGREFSTTFRMVGEEGGAYRKVRVRMADGDYFSTLGLGITGHRFTDVDTISSEPVCLISQAMARRYWPGADPIGKLLILTRQDAAGTERPRRIIGVVDDVRDDINLESEPTVYVPYRQMVFPSMNLIIHSRDTVGALTPLIQRAVQQIDPEQPVYVDALSVLADDALYPWHVALMLLGGLAGVALLLSGIGVFGVMSSLVRERMKEFGIRIALGAPPTRIRNRVLARAVWQGLVGVAIGLAVSLAVARVLGSLLYGVGLADPVTLVGVSIAVGFTSVMATYIPARRAMLADPVTCLREM